MRRTLLFLRDAGQGLVIGLLVVLLAWKGYGPSKVYLVVMVAIAGGFLLMSIIWCVIAGYVCREEMARRGEYRTLYGQLLVVRPNLFVIVECVGALYGAGAIGLGLLSGLPDLFMVVWLIVGVVAAQGAAESLVNAVFAPQVTAPEN